MKETIEVKEAMLNVVKKLNELLNKEDRDEKETRQQVSISTAMTGAGKTYLNAISIELKAQELNDKGFQG